MIGWLFTSGFHSWTFVEFSDQSTQESPQLLVTHFLTTTRLTRKVGQADDRSHVASHLPTER